jgi:endogenous inhibitor of DNA gyrase (YacG/DUF329 family)
MNDYERNILSEAARLRASMRTKSIKVCPVCNKSFEGIKTAIFCSDACHSRKRRNSYPTIKICPVCGKETEGQRANTIFCSAECRRKSNREHFKQIHPRRTGLALLSDEVLQDLRANMRNEILAELGMEDPNPSSGPESDSDIQELS